MSSTFLISLFLDLVSKYNIILFCSSAFPQNTTDQRPPATCHVDHNKSADRPPVGGGKRTHLSTPSPCQPRYLITNILSKIVIDYCRVYNRGSPSSAIVYPLRRRSSTRQEHQGKTYTLIVLEFWFQRKFYLLTHSLRKQFQHCFYIVFVCRQGG